MLQILTFRVQLNHKFNLDRQAEYACHRVNYCSNIIEIVLPLFIDILQPQQNG